MKGKLMILGLVIATRIYSQDIMAAYIETRAVSPVNTQSIVLALYVDGSQNIARPTVSVNFGDGTSGLLTGVNQPAGSATVRKLYTGTHTYSGSGTFSVSYLDTFRIAGIRNILNSQTQQIYIQNEIHINNLGYNSSPTITFPPIDKASGPMESNFGYFDNDGDSLSYSLTNCLATNYYLPAHASVDSFTGLFSFSPDSLGWHAFSIKTDEWRKNLSGTYIVVGSSQMDFIVNVTGITGLTEPGNKSEGLFVYPNPATNELNIFGIDLTNGNYHIKILNCLGQLVLETQSVGKINIAELPGAIYTLILSDKNTFSKTFKFVKD